MQPMDTKSMEVTVRAQPPTSPLAFATAAIPLFVGRERFSAEATEHGLKVRCVWWSDLDDAWSLPSSALGGELIWTEPIIILKYETVVENGKPRNITLEPVLRVEVDTPGAVVGSVIGDLSSRRGMLTSMIDRDGERKIVAADVPLSELRDYPKTLEALSGGTASVTVEFHGYQEQPRYVDPDPDEPMSAALRA
jgi:Elongation factor G C-terminus